MKANDPLPHYVVFAVRMIAAIAPIFITAYALFLALVLNDYSRATFWMVAAILTALPTERAS